MALFRIRSDQLIYMIDAIEETRWPVHRNIPDLVRIVVAIGPAVSTGDDADETGIIVAGKGKGRLTAAGAGPAARADLCDRQPGIRGAAGAPETAAPGTGRGRG